MNEDPLQREAHDEPERPRPGLPLRLVTTASEPQTAATEMTEPAPVPKHALDRLNVIYLGSAREKPEPDLLGAEFSFARGDVGSAVIHTCMSSNDRQSAHGWLFQSAEPDLASERPIGELAISSSGASTVRAGCPSDYDALRLRVVPARVAAPARSRKRIATVLLIVLGATFTTPWLTSLVITDRGLPPKHLRGGPFAATPWGTVTPVDLPPPIVLSTPDPPAQAAEERVAKPPKPRRAAKSAKQVVAQAPQEKPRVPVERVAQQPKLAVQGASSSEAPVSQPPRIVFSQRAAPVIVETGGQRLAREQALCDERGFIGRAFCREGARWRHCHPDKWDVAPECMVKADTMQ